MSHTPLKGDETEKKTKNFSKPNIFATKIFVTF